MLVLNDFCHVQGGASKVAVDEAVALAQAGARVTFVGAVGPVCDALMAAPLDVACLDQPELMDAGKHPLALLRSMLTHPEAAQTLRDGAARFEAEISRPIPADDADVRAALVGAVMLGVIVSRHLLNSDVLTAASPEQIIDLLRPGLRSLTRADLASEG